MSYINKETHFIGAPREDYVCIRERMESQARGFECGEGCVVVVCGGDLSA